MRPTPEETLDGADRLLRAVLDENQLPADAKATISDVIRMLGAARKAVAGRPAFLEADNDAMRRLLAELIRELPPADTGAREQIRAYLAGRVATSPG
ncbi:MAG TPA: hypothetical protein VNC22_10175 [Sporichthya sp.]|jgi:hypothetical protein|nr:hypothetical protein [Sporichthya sp.]